MRVSRLLCLVALGSLSLLARPASARVAWAWSFNGTESGVFLTDGLDHNAGTFTITSFSVDTSLVSTLVGDVFTQNQPTQGFVWDGSSPTSFFRDSGNFTNGANFNASDGVYRYTFFVDGTPGALLRDEVNNGDFITPTALTVVPLTRGGAAPEPGVLSLLALGGAVLYRRKRA